MPDLVDRLCRCFFVRTEVRSRILHALVHAPDHTLAADALFHASGRRLRWLFHRDLRALGRGGSGWLHPCPNGYRMPPERVEDARWLTDLLLSADALRLVSPRETAR